MTDPAEATPVSATVARAAAPPHVPGPYIPASRQLRELTVRGVALGSVLGMVFAASSVYLALKVGLTVLGVDPHRRPLDHHLSRLRPGDHPREQHRADGGLRRRVHRRGVAFTLPALLLMGYDLLPPRCYCIALLGGLLGVLMMIPLRHGLIVRRARQAHLPRGHGLRGRAHRRRERGHRRQDGVLGLRPGLPLQAPWRPPSALQHGADTRFAFWKGASLGGELTPEMLGVGCIIGPRTSSQMMAGGVLAYLVLIPLIAFFGEGLSTSPYSRQPRSSGTWTPTPAQQVRALHRRRRGGDGRLHQPRSGPAHHA